MSTSKTKGFYGYKVIAAIVVMMMLNNGCASVYSVYFLNMAERSGSSLTVLGYTVTVSLIVTLLVSLFFGAIDGINKLGVKNCLYLSTILCAAAYVIMGMTSSVILIFLAIILIGVNLAVGCVATASVLVSMWFIEKRSEMLGIVTGALLMGSTIMVFISSRITAAVGDYSIGFYVLAGIILVGGFAVNLLVIRTPEQMGQKPLGWEKEAELLKEEEAEEAESAGISRSAVLRSFAFWATMIAVAVFSFVVDSIAIYIPSYCISFGVDEVTASNYYMIYLLVGFVGGIVAGVIDGKLGHKAFIILLGACLGVGTLLTVIWPANGTAILMTLAMVIAGFGIQSCNQSTPTLALSLFGKKHYASVCNYGASAQALGSGSIAVVMGICMSMTGSEAAGMRVEFIGCVIATFVSIVLVLIALQNAPINKKKSV